MKKLVYTLFLVFTFNIGFSQADKCTPILQKDFLDRIKEYKPTDLVPYYVVNDSWPEKWGLMDKKTKKKLSEPLMNYASTFNPNLSFFYDECDVNINSNYEMNIENLVVSMAEADDADDPKIEVLDSIDGYKGFKVDEKGALVAYSKAYYRDSWHSWNISKPFLYENEYYAIVRNEEGNKVIINTDGQTKEGFLYRSIRYTDYKVKDENLLYIEDFDNNKGFITLSGSKYLYGKLLKSPFYHNELFGYSIQHDGMRGGGSLHTDSISKSGILDLTKMEWLKKPKKGLKIIGMCYTSDGFLKTDYTNREAANIYFIVLEDKFRYLIDEKGKKYIPK